jgi:hypothetical protein
LKQDPKKSLLAYGTTPSFPALVEQENPLKSNQYISSRVEELKQEYDEIVQIMQDTMRVQMANIGVTPIVGREYYLYGNDEEFLSMIAPDEWTEHTKPKEYLGCFILTTDGIWKRQTY